MQAAVAQLQGRLPRINYSVLGLAPGVANGTDNGGDPGAFNDNQHTSWLAPVPGEWGQHHYYL